MKIDLKPALDEKKLDARLIRDFEKYNRKALCNALHDLLPQKLIPVFVGLTGVDPQKQTAQINKAERRAMIELLKGLSLTIDGARPVKEAIVTAGGIDIKEIHPGTMESKRVSGLFFVGEVIDVDGYTGGFNLTAAFSTGHLAGESC